MGCYCYWGGHAGCEAAAAAARVGATTLLVTHRRDKIGEMSCNPAIGGLGKGHLVREIDALDGLMGRVIDKSGIQFRMLNLSKGPAVRGPRSQADRKLYRAAMQEEINTTENLTVMSAAVADLQINSHHEITGIFTEDGEAIAGGKVILTTGTFLRGMIFRGQERIPAGRVGEAASTGLSVTLDRYGFPLGRLKTGTPPRLDGNTIDWSVLQQQLADPTPVPFSFLTEQITVPQIPCHITWTNPEIHRVITENLKYSAMYSGAIAGTGPRYCPSIEDKVVKFAHKPQHQIFWNLKALTMILSIQMAYPPLYRHQSKRLFYGLSPALPRWLCAKPAMLLNMTLLTRGR